MLNLVLISNTLVFHKNTEVFDIEFSILGKDKQHRINIVYINAVYIKYMPNELVYGSLRFRKDDIGILYNLKNQR